MYYDHKDSIYYRCPGHNSLTNMDVPPKEHFPAQPNLDPLDLAADTDSREWMTSDTNHSTSMYL